MINIKEGNYFFKIIIFFIVVEFALSPSASLWAQENLFGNGYRDYLNNKIRNGYNLDTFMGLDRGQKEKIAKRKQLEELVETSRWANADLERNVQKDNLEKAENSQVLENEVTEQRKQREKNASATGEFQYIAYADGKKEYFTDGLVTTIENERATDEFGNLSRKDTRDMKYNTKRLLISYQSAFTDAFGSTTKAIFDGTEYSPDSVFYGSQTTSANKTLTKYHIREIDAGGNATDRYWQADKVEGKFVTAFTQNVLNPVYGNYSFQRTNIRYENNDPERMTSYHEQGTGQDGLFYTLNRTNTTYNGKGEAAHYHEVKTVTQVDGSKAKVSTAAQFEYLEAEDGDRILKSIITTTTENPDGSQRTEVDTSTYNYDAHKRLMGGSGSNQFTGQEAKWWEYKDKGGRKDKDKGRHKDKDKGGHILSRKVDKDGDVTHSYVDPDTLKTIIVPQDRVTAILKDGNLFSGTSEIQFEILHGKPMVKQVDSLTNYYNPEDNKLFRTEDSTLIYNNNLLNNLQRVLSSQEHIEVVYPFLDPENDHREIQDITTTYYYDNKGNLMDAAGKGQKTGYEYSSERGWWGKHTSTITLEYEVILGRALRRTYDEDKQYQ